MKHHQYGGCANGGGIVISDQWAADQATPVSNYPAATRQQISGWRVIGNTLGNALIGRGGNDWVDGGGGFDVAVFSGKRADYFVSTGFGKTFVAAQNGVGGFDTLLNIERLTFDDGDVNLGASALAADVKFTTDKGVAAQGSLPDPSDQARTATTYAKSGEAAHGSVTVNSRQLRLHAQCRLHRRRQLWLPCQ